MKKKHEVIYKNAICEECDSDTDCIFYKHNRCFECKKYRVKRGIAIKDDGFQKYMEELNEKKRINK